LLSKIQGHDVESEEESGSEVEEDVMWAAFFNKKVPLNEIEIGWWGVFHSWINRAFRGKKMDY
jgi:hypothetical protein